MECRVWELLQRTFDDRMSKNLQRSAWTNKNGQFHQCFITHVPLWVSDCGSEVTWPWLHRPWSLSLSVSPPRSLCHSLLPKVRHLFPMLHMWTLCMYYTHYCFNCCLLTHWTQEHRKTLAWSQRLCASICRVCFCVWPKRPCGLFWWHWQVIPRPFHCHLALSSCVDVLMLSPQYQQGTALI